MKPWPAVLLCLTIVAGDAAAASHHADTGLFGYPAETFEVGDLVPETYELVPVRGYAGFSTVRIDGDVLVVEPRSRTIVLIVGRRDQPSERLIPPIVQMRNPAFVTR